MRSGGSGSFSRNGGFRLRGIVERKHGATRTEIGAHRRDPELQELEDSLRSLVAHAEKAATESTASLKKTAQIIEREAEVKAQQVLNEATQEMTRAKAKLAEVRNLRETIVKTIRTILTAQLDMLSSLESELLRQEPSDEILDIKSIIASIQKSESGDK